MEALRVATLDWRALTFDFLSADASRASLAAALTELAPAAAKTVLRVTLTLTGTAAPDAVAAIHAWLAPLLATFLVGQRVDKSRIALSAAERADLQSRHPILRAGAGGHRSPRNLRGRRRRHQRRIPNFKSQI
ncbi:MAG: hypothetical protein J6386_06250 [Candidatus Synoicihabitans palmerolidicus]|nr:hypothetical protein [Candidatus Synoicihabitans palmerolidicus]